MAMWTGFGDNMELFWGVLSQKHRENNDHWTQDEGLFIPKTMIIGHRMKLFILMPGGSELPSLDTTASKGYVTRILLAAMFKG
jgi:hypothetical protein